MKILLIIHAVVTFAAGVVLVFAPALIPAAIGVTINPGAYILSYFLGAAEISLAFLSYASSRIEDLKMLKLVSWTFIVFHTGTAGLEILAFTQGTDGKILLNVALRLIISGLFFYHGIKKQAKMQLNS